MPLTTVSQGLLSTDAQYTGFKNRIINGDMTISQRNGTSSVTVTDTGGTTYTLDRWFAFGTVASRFSVQQNAGSVTPPVGFTNYLGATSLSAYSVLSGDNFQLTQRIEGFNTADLNWGSANAQSVTISFWVRSSLTGTFGGSLRNDSATRSYPFSYTISAANTWEYKTITIAGDTTGTWNTTNAIGIGLTFNLGSGASFSGTAGAWANGDLRSSTGAVSVVGTNGATFFLTGVQLERGNVATSFDVLPYGTELALCERYYQKLGNFYFSAYNTTGEPTGCALIFKTEMRTAPTVAYGSISGTNYYGTTIDDITTASYRAYSLASGNGRLFFGMGNVTGSAEL